MAIRHLNREVKPLTRELAMDIATMPGCKQERPLNRNRIAMLDDAAKIGLFYGPHWVIAYVKGNPIPFRINGQHSSNMLVECNGHFPTGLLVTIDRWEVDDERDLANLFAQFDRRESARTSGDIAKAHKASEPSLFDIKTKTAESMCSGIGEWMTRNDAFGLDPNERATLMHTEQEFMLWANQFAGDKGIKRVGVFAAMYATWLRNRERALTFWTLVRDGTSPDPANATRTLRDFLTELRLKKQKGWDSRAVTVKCIHAWNAYWQDRTTDLKYRADCRIPDLA